MKPTFNTQEVFDQAEFRHKLGVSIRAMKKNDELIIYRNALALIYGLALKDGNDTIIKICQEVLGHDGK